MSNELNAEAALKQLIKDSVESTPAAKILGYMKKVEKGMDEEHPEELSKEKKEAKKPLQSTIDELKELLKEKDKVIDELQAQIAELSKPTTDRLANAKKAYPHIEGKVFENMDPEVFDAFYTNAEKLGKINDASKNIYEDYKAMKAENDKLKQEKWETVRDELINISQNDDKPYTVDELEDLKKSCLEDGKDPIMEVAKLVRTLSRAKPAVNDAFVKLGLPMASLESKTFTPPDSRDLLSPIFKKGGRN